jgi:methanogenic corrinoid protein MtbC1
MLNNEYTPGTPGSNGKKRRVMVGAIGKCVHNLGVETFADWMEDLEVGYVSVKLGPAVPINEVINKIREARPEIVGVSMRLGDLHVDKLVHEFIETATNIRSASQRERDPLLLRRAETGC